MSLFLSTFFETDEPQNEAMDIVSQAAHDIRSPLTALNFSVHALKKQGVGEDGIDLLNQAITRINDIAEDILKKKKRQSAKTRGIDMLAFAQRTTAESFKISLQKDILITVRSSIVDAVHAFGNESQLRRVMQNLIENSCDAGAKNIWLDIDATQGVIRLVLKDDGEGISPEIENRIGEEGFTTKVSGNGLGVFSAKKYVSSWGGSMNIRSLLVGTEIQIELNKIH